MNLKTFITKCRNGSIPIKNIQYIKTLSVPNGYLDTCDNGELLFFIQYDNYHLLVKPIFSLENDIIKIKLFKENYKYLTKQFKYESVYVIPSNYNCDFLKETEIHVDYQCRDCLNLINYIDKHF